MLRFDDNKLDWPQLVANRRGEGFLRDPVVGALQRNNDLHPGSFSQRTGNI